MPRQNAPRVLRRFRWALAAAALAGICLYCGGSRIPPDVVAVLERAESLELLSLDPAWQKYPKAVALMQGTGADDRGSSDTELAEPPILQYDSPALQAAHGLEPGAYFHGWIVLGRANLEESGERAKLLAVLKWGARLNKGVSARCFSPRHGIRATHQGKTVCLVICFECYSARCYQDGKQTQGFSTTRHPQRHLNAVLRRAGIPLAE